MGEELPPEGERRKAKSDCWAEYTQQVLLIILLISFLSMFYVMSHTSVPAENHDLVVIMVQALTGALLIGMQYYFGSTAGSKKSIETLSTLATKAPAPPAGTTTTTVPLGGSTTTTVDSSTAQPNGVKDAQIIQDSSSGEPPVGGVQSDPSRGRTGP